MNKDLEFIATHLEEWPDDERVRGVWLNSNGEIRFSGCGTWYDFYPLGRILIDSTGKIYTQQEWEDARKTITNKNNSVLFHELLKQHFGDNTEWFYNLKVGEYCIDLSCYGVSDG